MRYASRPMAQAVTKPRGTTGKALVKKPADTKCNARTRSGKYCSRPSGWGTDHIGQGRCKLHGGSTPLHEKAAEIAVAREAVNTLGLSREIHPMEALLEELWRTAGAVQWLGDKVNSIEEEKLVAPSGGGQGAIPEWKVNVWVGFWQAERAHMAKVSKLCLDAGIDERKVKLAEHQGQMIAKVLQAVIDDLELSAKQKELVPELVRKHLSVAAAELGEGAPA